MGAHNTVNGRIVVGGSLEEGLSDTLLIDLVGSPVQRQLTEMHQKATEAGRSDERRGNDDALRQLPSRIVFNRGLSLEFKRLIAHCGPGPVETLTQVHTRAMNAL